MRREAGPAQLSSAQLSPAIIRGGSRSGNICNNAAAAGRGRRTESIIRRSRIHNYNGGKFVHALCMRVHSSSSITSYASFTLTLELASCTHHTHTSPTHSIIHTTLHALDRTVNTQPLHHFISSYYYKHNKLYTSSIHTLTFPAVLASYVCTTVVITLRYQ